MRYNSNCKSGYNALFVDGDKDILFLEKINLRCPLSHTGISVGGPAER
jgi:hypothetical protein